MAGVFSQGGDSYVRLGLGQLMPAVDEGRGSNGGVIPAVAQSDKKHGGLGVRMRGRGCR